MPFLCADPGRDAHPRAPTTPPTSTAASQGPQGRQEGHLHRRQRRRQGHRLPRRACKSTTSPRPPLRRASLRDFRLRPGGRFTSRRIAARTAASVSGMMPPSRTPLVIGRQGYTSGFANRPDRQAVLSARPDRCAASVSLASRMSARLIINTFRKRLLGTSLLQSILFGFRCSHSIYKS